jgi:predicted nucleotidyltransferase
MHALWRETGAVQGKAFGGYKRSRLEPYAAAIKEQLSNSPSMTLMELQSWLDTNKT